MRRGGGGGGARVGGGAGFFRGKKREGGLFEIKFFFPPRGGAFSKTLGGIRGRQFFFKIKKNLGGSEGFFLGGS